LTPASADGKTRTQKQKQNPIPIVQDSTNKDNVLDIFGRALIWKFVNIPNSFAEWYLSKEKYNKHK